MACIGMLRMGTSDGHSEHDNKSLGSIEGEEYLD
jgi:hypothetical protein